MSAKDFKDELSILQREPALVSGAIAAIIGLLSAVGLQVDDNTTSAVTAAALAVIALISALVIRTQVTPAAVAQKQIDKAAQDSAAAGTPVSSVAVTEGGGPSVVEPAVATEPEQVEVIDAPAPEVHTDSVDESDDSVAYDPNATVPEGEGAGAEQSDSVVESNQKSDPLADAVSKAQAAAAAKAEALELASKQVQDYSTRLDNAQQELAKIQSS